ncbi:MAG: hypothetical protein AAGF36_09660 [Pseudomonadota bacterium]
MSQAGFILAAEWVIGGLMIKGLKSLPKHTKGLRAASALLMAEVKSQAYQI